MSADTHTHTQPCIRSDALSNQASGSLQTSAVCHQVTLNTRCSRSVNRMLNNGALSPPKTTAQLNKSAGVQQRGDAASLESVKRPLGSGLPPRESRRTPRHRQSSSV